MAMHSAPFAASARVAGLSPPGSQVKRAAEVRHEAQRAHPDPDAGRDRPLHTHRYARCPERCCFGDWDTQLDPRRPYPHWLLELPAHDGDSYVYVLRDDARRCAYVGYSRNVRARMKQHWNSAHRRDGAIGWLHRRLVDTSGAWEPLVELHRFRTQTETRAYEGRLQRTAEAWAPTWHVDGTR
jgi:hypothetical protein